MLAPPLGSNCLLNDIWARIIQTNNPNTAVIMAITGIRSAGLLIVMCQTAKHIVFIGPVGG
jgi:hypothetical protein